MHAVILAGGKGVRLRPYTTRLPKPLVPIGDEHSILEIVLSQLSAQGFESVTLAIGHLGPLIRAFVGDGSRWGLSITYLEEHTPLGTIGPLLPYLDRLPDTFLVMNGDVLTDINYSDVLRSHQRSGAPLTVATYQREVKIDFGVLESQNGSIVSFREKPVHHYSVSMGV
ncbi:MAG: NTP transferase domain-containing protein, partial [Rhodococcus sp.]|nr:NTP transferase domain-containing protein [Rhodococcus sp. (in: high G+C Gram-positive bacteria)]